MPYIVLAKQLAFQKTKTDSPTTPDGPEEIVKQGDQVPDYVPTFVTSALVSAGTVVYVDDKAELPQPALAALPVRTPDQPVVLPSDPDGVAPTVGDLTPVSEPTGSPDATPDVPPAGVPAPPVAPLPALPKAADSKEAWEQYATHPRIGMTLGEAEAMNKTDLMTEVKARHAKAAAQ